MSFFTEVGQQIARFSMRGDRTMFLFTFTDHDAGDADAGDIQTQRALLRRRFGNSGWECRRFLKGLMAVTCISIA